MSTLAAVKERQRVCYGPLAKPAERADLYWSREQPELKGITAGEVVARLIETQEFREILMPKLRQIDQRNRTVGKGKQMGRPLRWTALQLESVFLYRRYSGTETLKEAWTQLCADPKARLLLGLGEQVPSRATLTRYVRQHFDEEERCQLHSEIDRCLRRKVVQLPGFDQEARVLGMDGSLHGTHFTPPIPNPREKQEKEGKEGKTPRKIVNDHIPAGTPGAITAPTAGYIGKKGGPKAGRGFCFTGLWTEHGTLLNWEICALNESEKPSAERLLASYEKEVLPYRDNQQLSVLTADAGFNSQKIRRQVQSMPIVPNIHKASHKSLPGEPKSKTQEAQKRNEAWYPFRFPSKPDYENWGANGHGEIGCQCGQGQLKNVREVAKNGAAIIATKGCCSNCGNITITSGKWKRPDKKGYVRCYREDQADWTLGNSLTFNDKLSKVYGNDRFGWNESLHATMRKRFGLLKDKSWMRDITEVKTEFAIATSAISILLLERAKRQNEMTPASVELDAA
ncbi:MAG TPA: hypothetical protein VK471_02775 [Solirubrobacterales bacterium]|nr:hypothetical protein [Solirubrobacterales bacterium]